MLDAFGPPRHLERPDRGLSVRDLRCLLRNVDMRARFRQTRRALGLYDGTVERVWHALMAP